MAEKPAVWQKLEIADANVVRSNCEGRVAAHLISEIEKMIFSQPLSMVSDSKCSRTVEAAIGTKSDIKKFFSSRSKRNAASFVASNLIRSMAAKEVDAKHRVTNGFLDTINIIDAWTFYGPASSLLLTNLVNIETHSHWLHSSRNPSAISSACGCVQITMTTAVSVAKKLLTSGSAEKIQEKPDQMSLVKKFLAVDARYPKRNDACVKELQDIILAEKSLYLVIVAFLIKETLDSLTVSSAVSSINDFYAYWWGGATTGRKIISRGGWTNFLQDVKKREKEIENLTAKGEKIPASVKIPAGQSSDKVAAAYALLSKSVGKAQDLAKFYVSWSIGTQKVVAASIEKSVEANDSVAILV